MYLYVQKWESLKVYLKLLNLRLLDFQGSNYYGYFFVVAGYIDCGRGGERGVRMRVVNYRGVRGVDRQRCGWHGKGVSISDTSSLV